MFPRIIPFRDILRLTDAVPVSLNDDFNKPYAASGRSIDNVGVCAEGFVVAVLLLGSLGASAGRVFGM